MAAIYDTWFLGDAFLRQNYSALQDMMNSRDLAKKNKNKRNKEENMLPPMYLQEYYNPRGYYPPASDFKTTATSRVINQLDDALNQKDRQRLPRFLVIMLDGDLIRDVKDVKEKYFAKNLAEIVNWLTRQIDITVRRKRMQLAEKHPGALCGDGSGHNKESGQNHTE